MTGCKRINVGPVVYEEYESEVIAINLDSGAYYSLVGESAVLWKQLRDGASVDQLAQQFAAAHDADPALIAREVASFLQRLEAESLVVDGGSIERSSAPPLAPSPTERIPFKGFDMAVYTDMRDLLLLDPVHDVADSGWPAESPKPTQ